MKKSKINILFHFLLYILIFNLKTFAQSEYSVYSPDVIANSFGGSLITYTNDPAIVFWNPGGLSFSTEDKVLVNFNDPSNLNFIAFSKFIAPKNSIGFSYSKIMLSDNTLEVSSGAVGRRLNEFISTGAALNFGKYTETNRNFISTSFGLLLKPSINRYSFYQNKLSITNFLISPQLYDKFALGVVFHNVPLDNNKARHQIRIGSSFRFLKWGPVLNAAYHIQEKDNESHVGLGLNITSNLFFYSGSTDFDIDKLSFGGSIQYNIFSFNVGYYAKTEKISFSISVLLNKSAKYLAKQYTENGTRKIKEADFRGAYSDYLKSLSYQQNNKTLIYLSNVLRKRINSENSKIDSLFNKAAKFEDRGWYVNATLTYQNVLEIDPNNKKATKHIRDLTPKCTQHINKLYKKGQQLFTQDNFEKAKIAFTEILHIDDDHPGAIKHLAKIDSVNSYLSREYYYRGIGYYKQRHLNKAMNSLNRVIELNPSDADAKKQLEKIENEIATNRSRILKLFDEAHTLRKNGKYALANERYREIINFNKDNAQAVKQYDIMQSMISDLTEPKFSRAVRLYRNNDYIQAQALFKEILKMTPNHSKARRYLNLIRNKNSESVEQQYQQALQLYNDKRWSDALTVCENLLEIYPDHTETLTLRDDVMTKIYIEDQEKLGLDYFKNGDYLKAYKIFTRILELNPDNVIAKTYMGECELKLNKKISEIFRKGMEFYTNGQYELAIQEWDRVLEIDPNYDSAREYKKRAEEMLNAIKELE